MKTKNILKQIAAATSVLALGMTLMPAQSALAAFPGLNGRVIFHSNQTGQNQIFTSRLDGSDRRNLSNNAYVEAFGAWSADGKKIAFVSNRDGNNEVYTMNTDGSGQTRITNNAANDTQPAWSPDGTKLVFFRSNTLVISNVSTLQETVLLSGGGNHLRPAWSPDGTKIAFDTTASGNFDIYVINSDGTNLTQLTTNSALDVRPNWSPDGTKIVFHSERDGNRDLYTMNANGSDQTRLINTSPEMSQQGTWLSEQGTGFVFNKSVAGIAQIHTIDSSGNNVINISNNLATEGTPDIQPLTIYPATLNANLTLDATDGPVIFNAPANHTDTYEEIDPSSVTITAQPTKGSVAVSQATGEITYTQTSGTGQDRFTYQICSTANSQLCTTNTVTVNLASTASLASTGNNKLNLISTALIMTIIGSSLWLIRRRLYA